jgi:ribosomal protein S18 acetylase RimI-like enzyme
MLYRSFGFDEVGEREGYYQRPDGTRVSAYTMRCDLTRFGSAPPGSRRWL